MFAVVLVTILSATQGAGHVALPYRGRTSVLSVTFAYAELMKMPTIDSHRPYVQRCTSAETTVQQGWPAWTALQRLLKSWLHAAAIHSLYQNNTVNNGSSGQP